MSMGNGLVLTGTKPLCIIYKPCGQIVNDPAGSWQKAYGSKKNAKHSEIAEHPMVSVPGFAANYCIFVKKNVKSMFF